MAANATVENLVEEIPAGVENIPTDEPQSEEKATRKRVDENTVGFVFETKEEAEKSPPKYTDGETVETFYLYEVFLLKRDDKKQLIFNADDENAKLDADNSTSRGFVWGKSDIGHSALGYYAATKDLIAELADPKRRGAPKKKNIPAAGMIDMYKKLVAIGDTSLLGHFSAAMLEQFGLDSCKMAFGDAFSV